MEVILDTHALIWWFEGAAGLSKRASSIIASPGNLILISAAVGWELAIKVNLGKFNTPSLVRELHQVVEREGFAELPISLEHAVRAGMLPMHHRDPFDRLLVAQAQALGVAILSADRALDTYEARRIW
ncbi:MAG: type II toxin-antitoxin system VapC family toxin [Terriglobales bacterium]